MINSRRESVPARVPGRRWAALAALVIGGVSGVISLIAALVVRRMTAPSPARDTTFGFTPYEAGVCWDSVRIPTADGSTVVGWWLRRPESDRVIVGCHGYRSRKSDLLGIGAALWRHGYNVLLFDYRGHGEHAGSPVTLGYGELEDVLSAIAYVRAQQPQLKVGLIGYSMGASVALMAAARVGSVRAVVADSAFAAQRNPVAIELSRVVRARMVRGLVLALADWIIQIRFGFGFRDVEPSREVAAISPCPLLLIHGQADNLVDPSDSQLLFDLAGAPKELWRVPGVGHCGAYFLDRPAYVERVARFFDSALATPFERPAPSR